MIPELSVLPSFIRIISMFWQLCVIILSIVSDIYASTLYTGTTTEHATTVFIVEFINVYIH